MFRFIFFTVLGLGLAWSAVAAEGQAVVRRDTEFPVEVHSKIRSGSAKVGDTIEFRTAEAVLIGNNIVVPSDATILGTVVEVREGDHDSPRSLIRIRIYKLRWKNGEADLNAMVTSVRRPHFDVPDWNFRQSPTFMEGIRIVSHLGPDAYTDFSSDHRNFTIRSGVTMMLRQIDPDARPDRDFKILDERTAQNYMH